MFRLRKTSAGRNKPGKPTDNESKPASDREVLSPVRMIGTNISYLVKVIDDSPTLRSTWMVLLAVEVAGIEIGTLARQIVDALVERIG